MACRARPKASPARAARRSSGCSNSSTDGGGELWLCPICVDARDLGDAETVSNARIAGATPVWEWAENDTTVFSY